jgi:hypothetical protein
MQPSSALQILVDELDDLAAKADRLAEEGLVAEAARLRAGYVAKDKAYYQAAGILTDELARLFDQAADLYAQAADAAPDALTQLSRRAGEVMRAIDERSPDIDDGAE